MTRSDHILRTTAPADAACGITTATDYDAYASQRPPLGILVLPPPYNGYIAISKTYHSTNGKHAAATHIVVSYRQGDASYADAAAERPAGIYRVRTPQSEVGTQTRNHI